MSSPPPSATAGMDATAPATAPEVYTAELIELALGRIEGDRAAALQRSIAASDDLRRRYDSFLRAARRIQSEVSEAPWLEQAAPSRSPAADTSAAADPPKRDGDSATTARWRWWAFVCASMAFIFLAGAASGSLLQRLAALRDRLGMDRYIQFVTHSEDHPSVDPRRARPFYVLDREIVLQGRALPDLVEALEVTLAPLSTPDDVSSEDLERWRVSLQTTDDGESAFHWSFAPPSDGRLRQLTLRVVPTVEASQSDPIAFRSENLTYQTYVACLPAGPVAYVSESRPPEIADVRWEGDQAVVTLRSRGYSGGYLTLGVAHGGGADYVPLAPAQVGAYGEEYEFHVAPGVHSSYTLRPFALACGEPADLTDAIRQRRFADILAGEPRRLQAPR